VDADGRRASRIPSPQTTDSSLPNSRTSISLLLLLLLTGLQQERQLASVVAVLASKHEDLIGVPGARHWPCSGSSE
jgi:hypothetical protein